MQGLELSEIQGFLVRDYKEMPVSKYFLLKVSDAGKAKVFIKDIAKKITTVANKNGDSFLNIGFTAAGLLALGLHQNNVQSFIREFREGMVTPHRQRLLGDHGSSDPENWSWGGPKNEAIHLMLMVFARSEEKMNAKTRQLVDDFNQNGLKQVFVLDGATFPEEKEHFGFRESISQPAIIGSGVAGIHNDNIQPGEFVLGYKNEYNVYPDTPLLKESQGNINMLTADPGGNREKGPGTKRNLFCASPA